MGENGEMQFPDFVIEGGTEVPANSETKPVGDNFLTTNFNILKSEGLIEVPEDFNFDGTIETYKKAHELYYQNLKEKAKHDVVESVDKNVKSIIEAALSGVSDPEVLLQISKADVKEPITEKEKISFMENVLKEKGLDETVIETVIDKMKKDGVLDDKIKNEIKVRKEAIEQQIKAQKENEEQQIAQFVDSTSKVLDNYDWPKEKKAKIQDMIFKPTETGFSTVVNTLNTIFSDPDNLVVLADFLSYCENKDGKMVIDVSKFRNDSSKTVQKVKTTWENLLQGDPIKVNPGSGTSQKLDSIDLYNVDF